MRRAICAAMSLLVICASAHATESNIVRDAKRATALVDLGDQGSGSGFCIDASGLFITNNHVAVAMGHEGIKVVVNPTEPDQQVLDATVVARSSKYDLAILRVQNAKGLVALLLGDDSKIGETDSVTAFGYPFGKMLASGQADFPGISINTGKVTALRRSEGKLSRIQFDAAVNPGNSGGPVLDSNGKVVGIVVSGIMTFGGMTGVNFAIPISKLREFLSVPYARIISPKLNWTMRYEPLELKASVFQFGAEPSDTQLELVFDVPGEKPRTVPMARQPDGFYHATAAPMVKPADNTLVSMSALCEEGLVHGWSSDHPIHVAGKSVNLSQVNSIAMFPEPTVRTNDDRVLSGRVSDLGAITVGRIDGKGERSIDLSHSAEILVGDAEAADRQIPYRLIVRRHGNIVGQARSALTLSRSAGADLPDGQVEDSAQPDEADAPTLHFPYRIYSAAPGGNGRYLAMFLSSVRLVAVLDLSARKVVAYLPCDDDDALVAAGRDKLVVADNHAHEIRVYDLATAQMLGHRSFDPSMHFRRVGMGMASSGPVVLMAGRTIKFLDLATLGDLPLEVDRSINSFDDFGLSADGSTLAGWKLTDSPSTTRIRLRPGRAAGITVDRMLGQVYPNFDGSLLLGTGSVLSRSLRTLGQSNDMYRFLPCGGAGLYMGLTIDFDEAGGIIGSVFDASTHKTIAALPSLPELNVLAGERDDNQLSPDSEGGQPERIPLSARVIFDPSDDVLATIPPSDDRVLLRRFRLADAVSKEGSNALYVQSTPQTHFQAGTQWSYAIDARGGKGPLKYVLKSGPTAMQLSADGRLSWTPPAKLASDEVLVSVAISDAQQHHLDHTFALAPQIVPAPAAAATQPTAGKNVTDLFPLLHDDLYVLAGNWKWRGDKLHVDERGDHPRVQIACRPLGSYQLHVEFVLEKGSEVDLMVPAGAGSAAVILNGWDGAAAITDIKGRQPPRFMKRPFKLEIGRKYAADVSVELGEESARIKLKVDGKPIFNWHGQQEVLHADTSSWRLADPKTVGLGATDAAVDFTAAWVEPTSDTILSEYLKSPGREVSSYLAEWSSASGDVIDAAADRPGMPSLMMHPKPGATVSSSYATGRRFETIQGAVHSDDPATGFKIVCDSTPVWKSSDGSSKGDEPFSVNISNADHVELICSGGAKNAAGKWLGVRLIERDDTLLSPEAPIWSSVSDALLHNHISAVESEAVGSNSGREFDDFPDGPAILTGLRTTLHRGNRAQFVSSIQGIFLRPDGTTVVGPVHGKLGRFPQEFRAPPGYAIGSIGIEAPNEMRSIQVNYQRLNDTALEPVESMTMSGIQVIIGRATRGELTMLESKNRPIIGFGGHVSNRVSSLYIYTAR